jgi:hypothetical protein
VLALIDSTDVVIRTSRRLGSKRCGTADSSGTLGSSVQASWLVGKYEKKKENTGRWTNDSVFRQGERCMKKEEEEDGEC